MICSNKVMEIKADEFNVHPTKMGRCPACGRFVAWGLRNFINHELYECPILTQSLEIKKSC